MIGNAIARLLADAGARLTLAARDAGALGRLHDELAASGTDVSAVSVDVRDDDAVLALVARAAGDPAGREPGLDVAINNVGTTHAPAPLGALPLEDIDRVLAVNLRGVAVAMRAELNALTDGGAIVNVTSSAGISGAPGMSAYAAAKHGVVGLTRTAAIDYARRGIRVNAVAPGPIASGPIMGQPATVRDQVGNFIPLRRMGTPEDVAQAVLWLASPAAAYVTGTVLAVDGGKGA
ncbi:SDR family NAD(P)-dependent oxidoreductase [Cellulomonas sp. McL0617]|uniref:SDR family NAD(P)-dependent oxidoreductase n=1 Tax=Cellulomonas sp. McL0617 TaxID=3415675 RepID=UPI003CE8720C